MKYKKVLLPPEPYYNGRVTRYPDRKVACESGLRWHGSYEISYIKKGKVRLNKLDCEIILNAGDVYVLNSQEVHSYEDIGEDTQAVMLNIIPKAIAPYVDDPHIVPSFKQPEGEALEFIRKTMDIFHGYEEYKSKLISMKVRAVMYSVAYYLIRDCIDNDIQYVHGSQADDFDCAKSAIRYMHDNYKREITLNEIANYVGMTPAHFSKYFKDKTEETFSKYLRRVRLEHAIDDLRNKKITVRQAAVENGFPNVNSFILSCKSEYGRTPAELRNYSEKN